MPDVLGILKGSGSAIQLIKSLLQSNVPLTDVLSQVNAAGYNILPSTGNLVINYLTKAVIPANIALSDLSLDAVPNLASIPLSLTKTLRNFSYLVKLTGTNQFSGQTDTQFVSVSTNTLLTKQQALDAATSMVLGSGNYGGMVSPSAEVTSISQNTAGLTNLDSIIQSPTSQLSLNDDTVRNNLSINRQILRTIASGPVTPIVFSVSGQVTSDDILTTLQAFRDKYSS